MNQTRANVRWEGLPDLRNELGRLQREVQRLLGGQRWNEWWDAATGGGYPPVNLWEDSDTIYVESELPGLCIEELAIYVAGENQLTIQGERKAPQVEKGCWHRQERGYGKFSRVIELPAAVDAQKVDAEFKHGVLLVRLPKREEVKPRRVQVKVD